MATLVGIGVQRVELHSDGGGLTVLERPPDDADRNRVLRAKLLICAAGDVGEQACGLAERDPEWWRL
jgi:hypothetical protein